MNGIYLIRDYLGWHYTDAVVDITYLIRNFLWAVGHMFSVKEVLLTLFSPWKRLKEEGSTLIKDPGRYLEDAVVNLIMRIVGAIVRLALLCIAFISWTFIAMVGICALIVWFFLPVILLSILVSIPNVLNA